VNAAAGTRVDKTAEEVRPGTGHKPSAWICEGIIMGREEPLDNVDQGILRILSLYEGMEVSQLWYEMGEDDTVQESLTEEEVLARLKSLRERGLVDCVGKKWATKPKTER
jgi:hypothetical protein